MQKKTKRAITVVSENAIYEGVRHKLGFTWVYAAERPSMPSNKDALLASIHSAIALSNLSKDDKHLARKRSRAMNAQQLAQLARDLKVYRKKS